MKEKHITLAFPEEDPVLRHMDQCHHKPRQQECVEADQVERPDDVPLRS